MLCLAMTDYPHKNSRHPLFLWEWRKHRGYTSAGVAEKAAMQQSLYSAIETGSRRANVDQIISIAEILDIDPSQLFRAPQDPLNRLQALFEAIPEQDREKALKLLAAFNEDKEKST